MSRVSFVLSLALSLATASPLASLAAQVVVAPRGEVLDVERFAENHLDNLVGPIALYPDALLAQVLVAATFPDQVEDAARWVREHGTDGIDEQPWDVSVKSVAHYQSALNMMADKGDWTATLGRAYAYQSSDVMAAVQRMRRLADAQGNLVSTAQQQVVRESDSYVIVPAQPRVIYVPVYDPVFVYTRPIFNVGFSSRYWSFGVGFPIGGWLNYDLDWGRRAVYYNGWDDVYVRYGGGWRARSRPFIQVTNIYVSPRYRDVYVNRHVDRVVRAPRGGWFDSRRDGARDGNREIARDIARDTDRGGNRDGARAASGNGRDNRRRGGVMDDRDVGRSAQPRSREGSASPEGYRRGPTPRLNPPRAPDTAAPPAPSPERRSAPTRSAQPRTASDSQRGSRERRER